MNPLIIPLISVIAGSIMIIFLRYFQYVERMGMIEKGLNPFDSQSLKRGRISPDNTLRFGLLLIGAGLGLLIGIIIEPLLNNDSDGIPLALIMIFGGAGLLLSYLIQMKNDKKS
ncbi:DUF6249 domain-containing protein [Runella sp.]|uniref:DUF6249 domain-containing protein n=1 Tax=Runella sp. TaxID=1960881 RepID=UPI003D1029C8